LAYLNLAKELMGRNQPALVTPPAPNAAMLAQAQI
jgi:hypothetical protein